MLLLLFWWFVSKMSQGWTNLYKNHREEARCQTYTYNNIFGSRVNLSLAFDSYCTHHKNRWLVSLLAEILWPKINGTSNVIRSLKLICFLPISRIALDQIFVTLLWHLDHLHFRQSVLIHFKVTSNYAHYGFILLSGSGYRTQHSFLKRAVPT